MLFYSFHCKEENCANLYVEKDVNEMRVKVYEKEDTNSNIVYLFIYHDRA